jgi:ABC-type glycerol-3-phosphate transport system substrate-binding protein
MHQTRRQVLVSAGLGALYLAGCGGSSSSGGGGGGGGDPRKGTVEFTTWGSDAELQAFKAIIADFQRENPGATVRLREVPFEEVRQNVDAGLEAGKAPDLFRVTYQDIGFYSSQEALVDLSEYLSDPSGKAFVPALWEAVSFEGKPYGLPQHTDVSALVYNKAMLEKAGIRSVPEQLEDAWSWQEFTDAARKVRDAHPGKYGFAMNWQLGGSYRWLNWQWQAGGRLLNDDLSAPELDTPATRKTLEFFQSWYQDELVPDNSTPKGAYPDETFPSGLFGMVFAGDFLLPSLRDTVKRFEFGAMPLPRDVEAATDLGGNAVVVTRDSKNPALAARFADYLASEKQMRRFCEISGTLPTRESLVEAELDYGAISEYMPVYQRQATTLPEDMVKSVTVPRFTQINNGFTDQLEALVKGTSVDDTIGAMSSTLQDNLET